MSRDVRTQDEVIENLQTLDGYGCSPQDISFYRNLLARGECYVVLLRGGNALFGPCRFVGQVKNNSREHRRTPGHGTYLKANLERLLGGRFAPNPTFETLYQDVCRKRAVKPQTRIRKYLLHPSSKTNSVSEVDVSGGNGGPERREQVTYRVERDTKVTRSLKVLHRNRCQICGKAIQLSTRDYSEAHHLRPLGQPHNGPDVPGNIVILCPNHHVQMDHAVLTVSLLGLRRHPKHTLLKEFIKHHNERVRMTAANNGLNPTVAPRGRGPTSG